MGTSIIDRETFEVYYYESDYPKAFLCDQALAYPVSMLNKKGYKTVYSCSGHYYLVHETYHQEMYILFDKVYKFDNLPEGFEEETSTNLDGIDRTRIYYVIDNYKDDKFTITKERPEFETELEMLSQRLMKWVESLPENKERND